jgi:hypothetical protein
MIPFPIANFVRQFLRGFQVTTSANLSRGAALCGLVMKDHTWGWSTTGAGKYSPVFIERTPFQFAEQTPIGRAVLYMKELNRDQQRKFTPEAPIDFLPRRWVKHVVRKDSSGALVASRTTNRRC